MSAAEELVEELDKLTDRCIDLQASRSEVVEAIFTAYFQSDVDHEVWVRELIIWGDQKLSEALGFSSSECNRGDMTIRLGYVGSSESLRPSRWVKG